MIAVDGALRQHPAPLFSSERTYALTGQGLVNDMKRMQKILSLLCSFVLLTPLMLTPRISVAEATKVGDVDGDGSINAADALLCLQHSVCLVQLSEAAAQAADVDGSAQIDAADALMILQRSVGLNHHFPAQPLAGMEGLTYSMRQGQYVQSRGPVEIDGPRSYSGVVNYDTMHVNTDMAATAGQGYPYLMKEFNFNFPGEYAELHPEDLQYTASGEPYGSRPYVLLTRQYMDYFIREHLLPSLTPDTAMCSIVEPEMLRRGLYGDTYKQLWQEHFGTPWVDPLSSPEAVFQSQRLNIFTHTRAIETYADAIAAVSPDIQLNIAPHSTVAYSLYDGGITGGVHHMLATRRAGSLTAQVWSNTIAGAIPCGGVVQEYPFVRGYLGYGSFVDAARYYGIPLYALDDAMSDTAEGQNEPYWRILNHDQIVASLMQSDVNRWQFIYPDRSFTNVSDRYRTEQTNIHHAALDISGQDYRFTGGTPGIALLLSDTLSWQTEHNGWARSAYQCYYGLTTPLVTDGIPVRQKAMECITSPDDLQGVTLLMVSYDCMKPLSEQVNTAIAEWVRDGGTLLYLGGHDAYENMTGEWWSPSEKGGTPLNNLLLHLGLNDVSVTRPEGGALLEWASPSYQAELENEGGMLVQNDGFHAAFAGAAHPILTAGGQTIGFTSAVGQGHVVACSLSSAAYGDSRSGANLLRQLTRYALQYTNYSYVSANAFTARRGNYVAIHPVQDDARLLGTFVDIFDSRLPVVVDPVVSKGTSALYYDLSTRDDRLPRIAYSGSIGQDGRLETREQTIFQVTGAQNALISTRITAPKGLFPAKVEAQNETGQAVGTALEWDSATHSLLVQTHAGPASPTTVTVSWDTVGQQIPPSSHYEDILVRTNASGEDEAYLVENTGFANAEVRFCDLDARLVYRFDLDALPAAILTLSLRQNYLVEISSDNQHYQTVWDVSQEYDHRVTSENAGMRCLSPADYGFTGGTLYLRIRNTDPTTGWGGAISLLGIKYRVDGPSGAYAQVP